ncbi:MAG: zeta toxin family protein [Myxococcales bacterium]|nr:zeta toxin family protein [Myxococcales bacterium]
MLVVGGPSGSGKSRMFPVASSGHSHFNIDDRCRALHGSYVAIPDHVRTQAQQECEAFVTAQIAGRISFAVETTLRSDAAIRQAVAAKAGGFLTQLVYIATSDVAVNIERVALRALDGGHSAPPARLREIYDGSLRNLPAAIAVFDLSHLYDGSDAAPILVAEFQRGTCVHLATPAPSWLPPAIARPVAR